jgi:hypothetical protein
MLVVKQKVGDQTFKAQNLIKLQRPFEADVLQLFNVDPQVPTLNVFFFSSCDYNLQLTTFKIHHSRMNI